MFIKIMLWVVYFICIVLLIYKLKLFRMTGIKPFILVLVFCVKLISGIGLNFMYSHYYKDIEHADIYKYYNDSEVLYNISKTDFTAFVKIMSGGFAGDTSLNVYYEQLDNWEQHDPKYLEIIGYKDSNFFNSHRFVTKLNVFFHYLSRSFIATHTLFMCFLGFIGFTLLLLSFLQFVSNEKRYLLMILVYLFPSVMMWSGTILKESIVYLGIGLFTYAMLQQHSLRKKAILFILASIILFYIKFYIFLILLTSALLYYVYRFRKGFIYYVLAAFVTLFFISVSLLPTKLNPLVYISSKMHQQQKIGAGGYYLCKTDSLDFQVFVEEDEFEQYTFYENDSIHATFTSKGKLFYYFLFPQELVYKPYSKGQISDTTKQIGNMQGWYFLMLHYPKAKSYIQLPTVEPTIQSVLTFFPFAMKSVFLEPLPRSGKISILHVLSFAENIFVILLLILSIIFRMKPLKNKDILIFLFSFSVLLFILIGYTNPIAGNIIRHKIPGITFLLIAVIIFIDERKFLNTKSIR